MAAGALLRGVGFGEIVLPIGGVCGILLAMVVVVRAAGQPAPDAERDGAEEDDRPVTMPQQTHSVSGDRVCPHCQARLPDVWDAFCPECREPLS